jgi:hypothetical protein
MAARGVTLGRLPIPRVRGANGAIAAGTSPVQARLHRREKRKFTARKNAASRTEARPAGSE